MPKKRTDETGASAGTSDTKTKPKRGGSTKALPWTFPKNKLEDAIRLAQAIEEKNAGKPLRSGDLCKMVGFTNPDWRFLDLVRSANQYQLLDGSGATATISLTPIGADIVAPAQPSQRQTALLRAFLAVEQFKQVYEFYAGKKIPDDEFFANKLVRDFSVPRDRVPTFIEVFMANLGFLRAFTKDSEGQPILTSVSPTTTSEVSVDGTARIEAGIAPKSREFLDTCFVLMPFGDWFDVYFNQIYIQSCKDAGLEPIRADGLFTSGSVMEQIWEQIKRAKVLLAELSGKNPNVFYELGLAHALRKPVVFVTANLDDVPFDLRHLRVVVYDVREPGWDLKLRQDITTYLKNAKTEPDRSIPQPFRSDHPVTDVNA
jgi:hypothetical protein